jgi:superfamily I DNA and RNA helicase
MNFMESVYDDDRGAVRAILSSQVWSGGPRLARGVAGSGRTIVLSNNLARGLARGLGDGETLFEMEERPRLLAVCYNRTLAPFIRQKIDLAFRQGTGRGLPEDAVEIWHPTACSGNC